MADTIPGADTKRWTDVLSTRILETNWCDRKIGHRDKDQPERQRSATSNDTMLAHLISLPQHFVRDALATCLASQPFPDLLKKLPQSLHSILIQAEASDGSLMVPNPLPPNFYTHLASTAHALPAPQLLSLQHELSATPGDIQVSNAATAAMLARAVAAHLTLIRLIAPMMTARAFRAFSAAMPTSPPVSLQNVRFCTNVHPGGTAALAETFRKLPKLKTACVLFYHRTAKGDVSAAAAGGLMSLARYAMHPARLQSLAELTIDERSVHTEDAKSCIPEALSLICAPKLTCMKLELSAGILQMNQLLTALARFSALAVLKISTHTSPARKCLQQPAEGDSMPALPVLRCVEIVGTYACPPLQTAATLARVCAQTLTRLVVCGVKGGEKVMEYSEKPEVPAVFTDMWAAIGRCSKLVDLEVGWLSSAAFTPGSSPPECTVMAECFQKLPQLTRLALEGREVAYPSASFGRSSDICRLDGGALAPGILALTGLQQLQFCNGSGTISVLNSEQLLSACRACTTLSELWICVEAVNRQNVLQAAVQLKHMTRLVLKRDTSSTFDMCPWDNKESFEEFQCSRETRFDLHIGGDNVCVHDLPDQAFSSS